MTITYLPRSTPTVGTFITQSLYRSVFPEFCVARLKFGKTVNQNLRHKSLLDTSTHFLIKPFRSELIASRRANRLTLNKESTVGREPWSSGYRTPLWEMTHVWDVVCLNPGAIYWMDMTFLTLICCKIWIVCLKRPKINEKETRIGPFFKYQLLGAPP